MSDPAEAGKLTSIDADTGELPVAMVPLSQATAGGLIRLAREAAGLHIAALAVSLKVPVKKLEALESDRFDLLPDAVFVRALASSVCRTLKVDAAPVLELLPQTSSPRLVYQGSGINAPFRAPSDGPGPSVWTQVSRPAVLAGLAFLLAALVLIMMPSLRTGMGETVAGTGSPTQNSAPVKAFEGPAVSEPRVQDVPKMPDTPAESGTPAGQAATTSAFQSSQASSAPAVSVPSLPAKTLAASSPSPVAVTTPSSAAVAPLPSSSGIVVFTAKSESWVEVTDSKGQVVLRRILAAGEVVGASGALPLSAVVGRADATLVQVRGKAFDLGALAKDNVARFEVK